MLLTNNFTASTNLWPAVPLDSGTPSLGYHYCVLDYVWSNLTVNSGVTLNLTNGVAVGTLGATGLTVDGSLVSQGTPVKLNYLGSCAGVQEGPVTALTSLFGFWVYPSVSWQSIYLRFADLPMLGGLGGLVALCDSPLQPSDRRSADAAGLPVARRRHPDNWGVHGWLRRRILLSIILRNNLLDRCSLTLAMVSKLARLQFLF